MSVIVMIFFGISLILLIKALGELIRLVPLIKDHSQNKVKIAQLEVAIELMEKYKVEFKKCDRIGDRDGANKAIQCLNTVYEQHKHLLG